MRVPESTVKPSTRESLNTCATGAARSPNRSAIEAANSRAVRRRKTLGPGLAGAAHAVSTGIVVGTVVGIGVVDVPIGLEPPAPTPTGAPPLAPAPCCRDCRSAPATPETQAEVSTG